MKYAGDICPYCDRVLTKEWQKKRDQERKENAIRSVALCKANGNKLGRPLKYSTDQYKQVLILHKDGLSLRKIGKQIGMPHTNVARIISAYKRISRS